jgi:hypothetical protein
MIFYKTDDFSLDLVERIDIISLKDYLQEDEKDDR